MSEVYDKDIICVNPASGESRTIKASTDPRVFHASVMTDIERMRKRRANRKTDREQ